MGWGLTKQGGNPAQGLAKKLQELEVPLVTQETCQRAMGVFENQNCGNCSKFNDTTVVPDTWICAGGLDGAGICYYDSGEQLRECMLIYS